MLEDFKINPMLYVVLAGLMLLAIHRAWAADHEASCLYGLLMMALFERHEAREEMWRWRETAEAQRDVMKTCNQAGRAVHSHTLY